MKQGCRAPQFILHHSWTCHLKNAELEAKHQKYKGRVLRGDVVQDGAVWKTQLFFLNAICTVILWQDCYGRGNLNKSFLKYGWEKVPNWDCLFVHHQERLFLSVYVVDMKLAGKRRNLDPMWELLYKEVDLENQNLSWSCILGLRSKTMRNKQRFCGRLQNHAWIQDFRRSNGKFPWLENLRISSWSYYMEGHAKKCVERYCELANKTTQQLYKVPKPRIP